MIRRRLRRRKISTSPSDPVVASALRVGDRIGVQIIPTFLRTLENPALSIVRRPARAGLQRASGAGLALRACNSCQAPRIDRI
jgi:hypothetical protein